MTPRVAIIGIGNRDQGDDAAGLLIADGIRRRVPTGVTVVELDGDGSDLVDALAPLDAAIIVDAALSGAPPGTVTLWDAAETQLPPARFRVSSHAFGLIEAVEMARVLGQLPRRCVIVAIEAAGFGVGAPVSPQVTAAIAPAVERVVAELDTILSESVHA
jgi:hydrogenase maturation protease